jgi:hypothetical protein
LSKILYREINNLTFPSKDGVRISKFKLGMLVQAYNPSYLRGRDRKISKLKLAGTKVAAQDTFSEIK